MIPGLEPLRRFMPPASPPSSRPKEAPIEKLAALEQRIASVELEVTLLRIQVEQEVLE